MNQTTETFHFQAEVQELLGLLIHSLYSRREIFLRELISNASDALDKLRITALTESDLIAGDERLAIRIELEPVRRILRVRDNGIGMNRAELVQNLGTLASSGTRRFVEAQRHQDPIQDEHAAGARQESSGLIGQFGVGFYSSFMVADSVVVETRRAGESAGWRWSSKGDGTYAIEALPGAPRGTAVELHLKPVQSGEEDFLEPAAIASLVRRFSDFIGYPIEMAAAHFKDRGDLAKSKAPDGLEVARLNSMQPLWARPKEEIEAREYAELFRHLTHEVEAPLETIHLKAEGGLEYTALLFLPSERAFELFDPAARRSRVSLYVRRVFVMADCEELLPPWLRFVRGVVDSSDLPLNVSREVLQANRTVAQIQKHLVRKVLDALASMLAERRSDYLRFWRAHGAVLKEGIAIEPERSAALAPLCLFASSRGEELETLDEYAARMAPDQREIYVLVASDARLARSSPHLEALKRRGMHALLLTDPIDEWVLDRLRTFKDKPLRALDRGELDLATAGEKLELEARERDARGFLEAVEHALAGSVARARFSQRLVDSPAVLVDDERALGRQMERFLRESGREPPARARVLELNPDHPVVGRLRELWAVDPRSERVRGLLELLYGQALLAEGSPLPDPARFSRAIAELLLSARV